MDDPEHHLPGEVKANRLLTPYVVLGSIAVSLQSGCFVEAGKVRRHEAM